MIKKTVSSEEMIQQIKEANGLGIELFEKEEFQVLGEYLEEAVDLKSVVVCQIANEICLVGLTNFRLLIVKRITNPIRRNVLRIGLEQVKDLKFELGVDDEPLLVVFFYDDSFMKFESLSTEKTKKFAFKLQETIEKFQGSDFELVK